MSKVHKRSPASTKLIRWRLVGLAVLLCVLPVIVIVSQQRASQRAETALGSLQQGPGVSATGNHPGSVTQGRAQTVRARISDLHNVAREAAHTASEYANDAAPEVQRFADSVVEPVLQLIVGIAAFLSSLVAADRLFHVYAFVYYRHIRRFKPEHRYTLGSLPESENESEWPHVAMQIPMFNEQEDVIHQIVDCCCSMDWPKSKLTVQVCDDSTCEQTQSFVADKVHEWKELGINIELCWRSKRQGFKAGALAEAMVNLPNEVEYIAVFDVDFAPHESFLKDTVPWLLHNPTIGFVQTRWEFANPETSLLTKVQQISLNFHVKVEQFARCALDSFFNNNGTAGVWSRACINDAGGWNARTTVEDMDLSLRAYLRGWRFLFLYDVTCMNELPASYDAYRKQQYRWSAGPMQLFRKALPQIMSARAVPLSARFYIAFFFFGVRMLLSHFVSVILYVLLIPVSITFVPYLKVPLWSIVYVPLLVTLSTTLLTPGGLMHAITYVLFENSISLLKVQAVVSGLLDLQSSRSWTVTQKLGSWVKKQRQRSKAFNQVTSKLSSTVTKSKIYWREAAVCVFMLVAAVYGLLEAVSVETLAFVGLQASAFFAFAVGLIDNNFSIFPEFQREKKHEDVVVPNGSMNGQAHILANGESKPLAAHNGHTA